MYIIVEMQTQADGSVAVVPPVQKADFNEAQSAFYQACSYAAVSALPKHSVMMCDEEGAYLDSKCFTHGVKK